MNDFWRRLLYRWFIQYNPLYLVSAMLVLGGTILTSQGLAAEATESRLYGPLGVAGIAEVYAVALIGGAALLTRIGHRRPAVMLALLTALYQCDLTLHTETCLQLGTPGNIASGAWLALFVAKLFALAWAVQVRLSRGAIATAVIGGAGLALGPYVVAYGGQAAIGAFVAVFAFALGCLAPSAKVVSKIALDAWGHTVLNRTRGAILGLWGVLLSLHVLFWAAEHNVPLAAVIPAAVLLIARRSKSEGLAWGILVALAALVALGSPQSLGGVLILSAVALVLRTFDGVQVVRPVVGETSGPYRMGETHTKVDFELVLVPISDGARARQFAGALLAFYVGVWTLGWHGHGWPAHSIALDLFVLVVAVAMAFRVRPRLSLIVPTFAGTHALAVSGVVPTPHTMIGWGGTALVLGFALLLGALATSYRLRRLTAPEG